MWSQILLKVRNIFSSRPDQPREPRKKIELQLGKIVNQFETQISLLGRALEQPDLPESARYVGRQLQQQAIRMQEIQLAKINQVRLRSLPRSLIEVTDFSLWVKHELSNLTEEIYYFLGSINSSGVI